MECGHEGQVKARIEIPVTQLQVREGRPGEADPGDNLEQLRQSGPAPADALFFLEMF